jgi:lysophospholipase L1-like esterase
MKHLRRLAMFAVPAAAVIGLCLFYEVGNLPEGLSRTISKVGSIAAPYFGKAEIVMLGDSITARGDWPNLLSGHIVLNAGIPGDTSRSVLKRIEAVKAFKPSIVFLMIGVNDLLSDEEPPDIGIRVQKIIDELSEAHIRIVLQSVLHIGESFKPDIEQKIIALNEIEARLATPAIQFIDLNTLLAPNGYLEERFSENGLHLTASAYQAWASKLRPIIDLNLPH